MSYKNIFFTFLLLNSTALFSHCNDEEFRFSCQAIERNDTIFQRMRYTWQEKSPVALQDLRYIHVSHYDEDGVIQDGELVVHEQAVEDLHWIFEQLFNAKFPIHSMKLVDDFNGSDDDSMAANNSSAFFARKVKNTERWSNHSWGLAIDINPLWNPFRKDQGPVYPPEGIAYLDRNQKHPGMITPDSLIYSLFKGRGWEWGGECFFARDKTVDLHHFQKVIPSINQSTN